MGRKDKPIPLLASSEPATLRSVIVASAQEEREFGAEIVSRLVFEDIQAQLATGFPDELAVVKEALAFIAIIPETPVPPFTAPNVIFALGMAMGAGVPTFIVGHMSNMTDLRLDRPVFAKNEIDLLIDQLQLLQEQQKGIDLSSLAVGSQMRLVRQQNNFSLTKMAELLDCSKSYLSIIENGKVAPQLTIVEGYARELHVTDDTLLALWRQASTSPIDTLSGQLDGQCPIEVRREAFAILARDGQQAVVAYCRQRGVNDSALLADVSSDIWRNVFQAVMDGRYVDAGRPAMAYVFGVAHRTLQHYLSRQRRLTGRLLSLEDVLDEEGLAIDNSFEDLEQAQLDLLFGQLLERLVPKIDRDIAQFFWQNQDHTPPKIAAQLDLDVKTVRVSLNRIAEEVRILREGKPS